MSTQSPHDGKSKDAEAPKPSAWSGSFATVRDLEVLHTVIDEKKTTAAAARLGISQPAVSRTLAQMETRSGRTLFRRQGVAIVPTADALALYEETKPIFEILARLRDFQWTESAVTPLRIAAPPTIAQCFLEPLLVRFMRENPSARASLDIVTTPDVLELVADQRADLGVADVTASHSGLTRIPFRRSDFVCAMPADHALAQRASISPADLHGHPMVKLVKRNAARAMLDRLFAKAGVKPSMVMETSNALSAVSLAGQGMGFALVNPFPVALTAPATVAFRPFEPKVTFETAFFVPVDGVVSSLVQRFIEFIRQHQPPGDALSERLD
jgi:DNA-binding transcriptional LysR family regulator